MIDLFKRAAYFFWCLFFLGAVYAPVVFGGDRPFNNAANWGGTGLLEIPNARVLEDGVLRMGYAEAIPYRWYAGGIGIFPGLELSGRFTELTNVSADKYGAPGYGNYKDKAFDLKYQLLPESKKFPALAVGIHDFHGTRLFPAKYLVASRQIFPFDFTLGMGSGRLKGPLEFPLTDKLGLWGGIEWAVSKRLHLLAEYNPIEYEKGARPLVEAIPEKVKLPLNGGIRVKLLPGLDFGISYQRGDTWGFMGHLQFLLGKPLMPKKPDPPLWGTPGRRTFSQRDLQEMVDTIRQAVIEAGFENASVYTGNQELIAEIENNKYLSNQKAAGRVLRILLYNSPSDTQKLTVVLKQRQMPFLKVSVKPEHLDKYLLGRITDNIFYELVQVETVAENRDRQAQNLIKAGARKKFDYQVGIKPDIGTFWDYAEGEMQVRLGINPYVTATLWKGGQAHARYDIPFYSDIETIVSAPPDAVRSDSWKYSGTQHSLDRLIFDQAFRLSKQTFGRLSAGYFEKMYAGVGGEALYFWGDGNLALGVEGDWVRKRAPETQLELLDFRTHTLFGNMYYYIPGVEITLQAKYGRFLAGDVGWRFEGRRVNAAGVVLGAWYSITDTDVFEDKFNRGYNDKGVFISLPARMFTNYETNTKYHYAVSPWGRDVAATVEHWQNLFDLGAELMPSNFKSNMDKMKK